MKRAILADNFPVNTVSGHWKQDRDTTGGTAWDPIAVTSNVLTFVHDGNTVMATSNVAYAVRMPNPDYSVRCKLKIGSGDTGVLLIGLRCVGSGASDADRSGYWAAINFGETGNTEGTVNPWVADKARLYFIPSDFRWHDPDRLTLSSTEGVTDSADSKQADLTTTAGTYIEILFRVTGDRLELWADGTLIAVATDTDANLTAPGFVRLGVQGDESDAVANFENVVISSGLSGTGSGRFVSSGFDEAQQHAYFNVPANGQEYPSRQFVYDVTHDEWYLRDRTVRAIGQVLSSAGEQRLIFGDDDGRVSVLDASVNTWSDGSGTNAFTGTWQSNWLDMGDKQSRKTINKLIIDVAKATAKSTLVVTLEVRDHEDGYTRTRSGTVHMTNLRTPMLTQLGGRYLRIKLVHSGEGDVEIQRILAELVGARMDKVGAR